MWGANDALFGLAISNCESGFSNTTIHESPKEFSVGMFQINAKVHTQYKVQDLLDPFYNAHVAHEMYLKEGIAPWVNCSKALGLYALNER